MHQNKAASRSEGLDNYGLQATGKVKLDLLVLRYMLQRIHVHLLDLAASASLPAVNYAEERHSRVHRIIVYKRQETLLKGSLMFVGFISDLQEYISPAIIQEIHRVDKLLIVELANHPGLISYSSLELCKGHWYNLVLLSDYTDKAYFKQDSTHRYASHQLALDYYAWIRLHNGVIPGGLVFNEMLLQSTKYYIFPGSGQKPIIREALYDSATFFQNSFFSGKRSIDR